MTVELYLDQGKRLFTRFSGDPRIRLWARLLGCGAAGFCLSALGTAHRPQPFAMALVSAMTGWQAGIMGLGSILGCLTFWGTAGLPGVFWTALAALTSLLWGKGPAARKHSLLIPGLCALWVAAVGIGFQLAGRRITCLPGAVLAGFCSWLFRGFRDGGWTLRRGQTGLAQVRLEIMAQVLSQTRLILMETEDTPIDREVLLSRARERACGGCPNRRTCRAPTQIPVELLRRPLTENTALPFFCRKPGRMVLEIRRTQEQYRLLKADRQRRLEYRGAVSQQYLFLSEFLREQADTLPRRSLQFHLRFTPEVGLATRSREPENGDRFRQFSGPGGRYFLLLCDGMGTGMGAAEEGSSAADLLQRMLTAGFPPEHALESLNSLLALRGRAGAVTVDLAELRLDTGMAILYKWGAAPSLLLRSGAAEKIGTAGPPPGIRGQDDRERQMRLSLRRGETLLILSDGVDGEGVRRRAVTETDTPAGEMAARLLEAGADQSEDDATVAVVRLRPDRMLT